MFRTRNNFIPLLAALVAFALSAPHPAAAQYQTLYNFTGANADNPASGVIQDAQGNLYGTTGGGGTYGYGNVFKLDPFGNETVLYNFTGGADGSTPLGGVIMDKQGNLYGTTEIGGMTSSNDPNGAGVVFKVDPSGHETVLYTFTGGTDGGEPDGGVILDAQGNLYGTTYFGGTTSSNWPDGAGVVFKVTPSGKETVLYTFTGGMDGGEPDGGVILDAQGNLYGTTGYGGMTSSRFPGGAGIVFKLDPSGNETVLYTFTGGADGGAPNRGLIQDSQGDLYGTTSDEAGYTHYGYGAVFKLDPSGNYTALYTFTGGTDGGFPEEVILDAQGNLYGTTVVGGSGIGDHGDGVVFKLSPPYGQASETVLHAFSGGADGGVPAAGVILDAQGNLYGTTLLGGAYGGGVVFKLAPSVTSVVCSPPFASNGQTVTITVTLSVPAPPGGLAVTLTSSDPYRLPVTSLTIPQGSSTGVEQVVVGSFSQPEVIEVFGMAGPSDIGAMDAVLTYSNLGQSSSNFGGASSGPGQSGFVAGAQGPVYDWVQTPMTGKNVDGSNVEGRAHFYFDTTDRNADGAFAKKVSVELYPVKDIKHGGAFRPPYTASIFDDTGALVTPPGAFILNISPNGLTASALVTWYGNPDIFEDYTITVTDSVGATVATGKFADF